MGQSIAPTQPAHYPSISNKRVIFFHTLMSEIVPDTIIGIRALMSEIVPDTIIGKLSLTPLLGNTIIGHHYWEGAPETTPGKGDGGTISFKQIIPTSPFGRTLTALSVT